MESSLPIYYLGQVHPISLYFHAKSRTYNKNFPLSKIGIHTGGNGGGQRGSYSTYISDFSAFGDFGHHANNDQKPSSSSLVEIDPIAARFGVVIPNVDQVPFDPSLSGSTETFSGSTSTGR
jgi:hypothetical protein